MEKKEGSEVCVNSSNNLASIGERHIIKFFKNELATKDYEAIYTYDKLDSSIISIRFLWNTKYSNSILDTKKIIIQKSFKNKYYDIKSSIEKKFGKGIDNSIEETYVGTSDHGQIKRGLIKTLIWKVDNNISVKLDTDISSLYEKGELSTYTGIFKITLDIIDNSKTENQLSEQALNRNLLDFLRGIENDELKKSEEYLSPYIYEGEKTEFIESAIGKTGKIVKLKPLKNSLDKRNLNYTQIYNLRYKYIKPKKRGKNIIVSFDGIGKIYDIYEVDAKK